MNVNGARLQLLDWGGTGPLLVFLPGFGDGAHIFDDIAPAFRDRFHVVALTPRGFPPSSAPDSGYTITQLATDVRAVMDTLGAGKAVLAGHSISGAVITRFAELFPARLLAAVYLDAAFDFGEAYRTSQAVPIRHPPASADTTAPHFRSWVKRYDTPSTAADADARMWDIDSADASRRKALVSALATEVRSRPHPFWHVQAPALSICSQGSMDRAFGWLTPDSARWALAERTARDGIARQRRECAEFAHRVPHGRSLSLPSGHYVFIDQRAAVIHAVRQFLARVLRFG